MEVSQAVVRRSREMTPERVRTSQTQITQQQQQQPQRVVNAITRQYKKVQVLYYLSRNGQLEHPHFMEVTHLANQQLRLKDVMDRLNVLRGKGMPALFSWSCKRSYKNGYVWNDLSENDVIYPADGGAEYVLKGSELLEGISSESLRLPQLQVIPRQNINGGDSSSMQQQYSARQKQSLMAKTHGSNVLISRSDRSIMINGELLEHEVDQNEEEMEMGIIKNITTYNNENYQSAGKRDSGGGSGRRSRGVSTYEDEVGEENDGVVEECLDKKKNKKIMEDKKDHEKLMDDNNVSPPSTTTSSASSVSEKTNSASDDAPHVRCAGKGRPSSSSVLMNLISCGGGGADSTSPTASSVGAVFSFRAANQGKSGGGLREKVAWRAAAAEEERRVLECMSENPRFFGNGVVEEKEYFSGSIVERRRLPAVGEREVAGGGDGGGPVLKKSNSYNEERAVKTAGLGASVIAEVESDEDQNNIQKEIKSKLGKIKAKCIPNPSRRSKASNSNNNHHH